MTETEILQSISGGLIALGGVITGIILTLAAQFSDQVFSKIGRFHCVLRKFVDTKLFPHRIERRLAAEEYIFLYQIRSELRLERALHSMRNNVPNIDRFKDKAMSFLEDIVGHDRPVTPETVSQLIDEGRKLRQFGYEMAFIRRSTLGVPCDVDDGPGLHKQLPASFRSLFVCDKALFVEDLLEFLLAQKELSEKRPEDAQDNAQKSEQTGNNVLSHQ